MKLFLIRHGYTDYNKYRKYCGSSDIALNEDGIKQAHQLRSEIPYNSIDTIYSSSLVRAQKTAQILFPGKEIISSPFLTELDFGEWEGLTYEEIVRKDSALYSRWLSNPEIVAPPGGETLGELNKRVSKFYSDEIDTNMYQEVAIVSHAGIIRSFLQMLLPDKYSDFWSIEVDNCSYYQLTINDHLVEDLYNV